MSGWGGAQQQIFLNPKSKIPLLWEVHWAIYTALTATSANWYMERDIFQGFIYDYYNVIVIFQKYSCGMHLLDVMLSEIFRIIFYHKIGIRDTSQSQTHKAHQWKTFSCMATRLRRRYWSKKWKSMSKSLKVRRLFHRPEAKPAFAPSVSQGRSVLNMFC